MARFAPVAPLSLHQQLSERGLLGNYHLLIAPKVLDKPEAYQDFYRYWRRPSETFVIMDNGVIETEDPGNAEMLMKASLLVGADVTILPDIPDDAEATLQIALPVAEKLHSTGHKVIPVLQGTTLRQVQACARSYEKHIPYFQGFAVPRSLVNQLGNRHEVVEYLANQFKGYTVHLLGLSDSLTNDLYTANVYDNVVGVDSAIPVHMSYLILREWSSKRPKRPKDYWDWTSNRGGWANENVRRIRGWLNDVNFVPTKLGGLSVQMETPEAE